MPKTSEMPIFKNEEEEAAYWDSPEGQAGTLEGFQEAAQNGTLGRGTLKQRGVTPTTTIRLDREDVELAKAQAGQRGLRYQTYLKMLIHQALRQQL